MYIKKLISALLLLVLYACGSSSNNTAAPVEKNKATTELPAGLQKLALGSDGTLNAYITIDGDTDNRKIMNINPAGAGFASVAIPGLSRALHTVLIRYEYTTGGVTYIVASANKNIDLSAGSRTLNFSSTDYNLDAFDDDGDGINNAAELKAGSNPDDSGDPHIVFTSPASISVNEKTVVTGYSAAVIDVSGDSVTFSLSQTPGLDQSQFNLDSNTGRLSFKVATDFGAPGDVNQDNIYQLEVVATDGTNTVVQVLRITVNAIDERPFITVWKTDNPGFTNGNQIQISTSGGGYNYSIDWGDQQLDTNVTGSITHTYTVAGTYIVSISGDFPRIFFNNLISSDNRKLISIEQWGGIIWQSMNQSFAGCVNLAVNASDSPNLSQVTDMSSMFSGASSFNQDISAWDVSSVTDMNSMFDGASSFNQDISAWNVSFVTDMGFMFDGASSFNQALNAWNVSSVTDMSDMFSSSAFNRDLSSWVVLSVTNMEGMFRLSVFNQALGTWDVSSVTDMSFMFDGARFFNQALSTWDVSSVANMSGMFAETSAFNQDISSWNVSSVGDMDGMFLDANLSISNYDALLLGWSVQNLQNGVFFDINTQYSSSSQSARDTLTNAFGWSVTDGGVAP